MQKMQTLRKKSSPLKYKNETCRFLGEGVSFKAKLIGILEVAEARGDRMCQEALSDLKTAIRAAGEHKQRITINVAIDGLKLRDEKTGDSLYHHPVHKISFIAQDMTDSRAFGYIFGSPDTGHRFFGIKTDKAASQVVIAMRDLFQVVFALKKREVELAKQHLDRSRYGSAPIFSETIVNTSKISNVTPETSKVSGSDLRTGSTISDRSTPAVADLVDLELELNSLQQGLHQMERITPSDPFGSKDDPFGDSFTPFPKPILPPPPSSGKDRSSRISESGCLFSPKTTQTAENADASGIDSSSLLYTSKDSNEFSLANEEPSSGDWFTPPGAGEGFFEEQSLAPEQVKPNNQDPHEKKKQEILSQFDVFTDLDPLDPFGEDPFIKSDPFAETDFAKQDPFENEVTTLNKDQQQIKTIDYMEQFKISTKSHSRSSKGSSLLEKQISLCSVSPSSSSSGFTKQNTLDVRFDQIEDKKLGKLSQLHENPSLDLSSESECAPEPPPRPTFSVTQIKPPPLPPKKQLSELCIKPPPRPPQSDIDLRYDFVETYETAPNTVEFVSGGTEKNPPLPAPARKTKVENDFSRPRGKVMTASAQEDDEYLTPISAPKSNKGPILLPPPQKANRKSNVSPSNLAHVTVSSYLENRPNIITTTTQAGGDKNIHVDGLDITLSQLTLRGLNELATKLNIPAVQLSNMTLAQLTTYLSNFIKDKTNDINKPSAEPSINSSGAAPFPADFANFNNFNVKTGESYDRYAVFRELLEEEIKQTKVGHENEKERVHSDKEITQVNIENETNIPTTIDKYAALRDIVENEDNGRGKSIDEENNLDDNISSGDKNDLSEKQLHEKKVEVENEVNIINTEKFSETKDNNKIIEYNVSSDMKEEVLPTKSHDENHTRKSPIPEMITEIMNSNTARLTSGSLSDAISGSSPEIDNTGSNSEVTKKTNDVTGESWAIFDQLNSAQESCKEKQNVPSEEGASPWSSDSKEFTNDNSPPEWEPRTRNRMLNRKRRGEADAGTWWDTSAEPVMEYYSASSTNRRSTDSYDEEYYDRYERPRRRRQGGVGWTASGGQISAGTGGGHSSSSRDVSPWDEEPSSRKRDYRDSRPTWVSTYASSGRQHSFERHQDKRYVDSCDEEDDYEYEEEHCNRFYWHGTERHPDGSGDHFRWGDDWNDDSRKYDGRRRREIDRERWCCPDWNQQDVEKLDRHSARWLDSTPASKWRERDKYYSKDSQESPWEDEYPNDLDGGGGGGGLTPHYSTTRRTWKRPSSASEMDRKTGEIKARQGSYHLGTGGSDGERDRRYKSGRRSKSRESPFSDVSHNRHKLDPNLTLRSRTKHHHQKTGHFDNDYVTRDMMTTKKAGDSVKMLHLPDHSSGRKSSGSSRRKTKDSPKTEESEIKTVSRHSQSLFENDFVTTETESPPSATGMGKRFLFENDIETSEADSPIIKVRGPRNVPYARETTAFRSKPVPSKSSRSKQRSLFEDDFSPTEKIEPQESLAADCAIENDEEDDQDVVQDSFSGVRSGSGIDMRKKILTKSRGPPTVDALRKSESVNIFGRENDPFDDEFFSNKTDDAVSNNGAGKENVSPRTSELRWTEQFDGFDTLDRQ